MNDSTNLQPVFISDAPDWSRPVQVVISNKTTIAQTRNEGRQRAKWRNQPRYGISYFLSGLNSSEFAARRSKQMQELAAPVVCPIWPDEYDVTGIVGLRVSFSESLARSKFKLGSYVFIEQGTQSEFRIISGVGANYVDTLAGAIVFSAGALAFPCIFGMRTKNTAASGFATVDNSEEAITVEEL